jgi:hypothetical protein
MAQTSSRRLTSHTTGWPGLGGSDLYSLATRENTRWRERIRRVAEELQRLKQFADRRATR